MRLRGRLALNTFVAAVVLVPAVYIGNDYVRANDADRTLARAIADAMAGGGRARCETHPETFGGGDLEALPPIVLLRSKPESRPQMFAYDASLHAARPGAPPFPDNLSAALTAGAERAHLTDRTFRGAAGRASRPEGQGLGLHIVREVVDRHGFDLRFGESEYGGAEIEIDGACAE